MSPNRVRRGSENEYNFMVISLDNTVITSIIYQAYWNVPSVLIFVIRLVHCPV